MSALTGIRIVELAETVAGEYCGKLLADFGADVVKVEKPGWGSSTRAMTPGSLFAYLNTNKKSVVVLDDPTLDGIIDSAHAVIGDHTSLSELAGQHPDVVVCSVTPFGHDAPAEMQNAKSINAFHASGWGFHTPSHADPTMPPLKGPGRFLTDYEAGLDAALCVASCLFAQLHHGRGEFVDVSAHAVLVSRAGCILGRFIAGEIAPEGTRDDYDQQGPASFFACSDGHVYLYMTNGHHWVALKELMDRPSWLDEFDDDWLEFSVTPEKVARFHRGFAPWIRDKEKNAVAEKAQRLGVPLVPVYAVDELPSLPQYRHRRFFRDVTHPVLGSAAYPTVPYLLSESPAEIVCCLMPDNVRSPEFLDRLAVEAPQVLQRESAIWGHLTDAKDYLALSHWNANVDNAWFWTEDGLLRCGLMDWGCVTQLNVAMAIWGAMSGAETELWDNHFDEFLALFCDEVHSSGGPKLDPAQLERQVLLYAALMGITWLFNVPALIRAKVPDDGADTQRTHSAIKDDEGVRAPLQMLTNVLNLWESRDLSKALSELT
jgi:crotonobetainyl-CoA:carnitine CoA-transferase CaiB-like acyl-CoA transferase